jgi:hypothetical protein
MHILIPAAAPPGPQCQDAIARLQLPKLSALLQRLTPTVPLHGQAKDLSPLHERVRALALGLPTGDGLVPWAAMDASALFPNGGDTNAAPAAWAWITPCHWRVHADHVEMADPAQLALGEAESRAFMQAMQAYFLEDGIRLHWLNASTWLAQGEVFRNLPTASLERVRGAPVDAWIPRQVQAKPLRRLQNEMQMLLYTHPLNDARSAQGLPTVTSFWVSGTGQLPVPPAPATRTSAPNTSQAPPITVLDALQAPARQDDARAWVLAWQGLDAMLQEPAHITLCGENLAQTFALQPLSVWGRLRRRFTAPALTSLLKTL